MGLRSQVLRILPKELRAELDTRLIDSAFSDYRGLVEWLQAKGYRLSRHSLQRYGSDLAAISRATRQLKSIMSDHEGSMNDALISLIQSRLFDVLVESEHIESGQLMNFARAITELGRATVQQKKWAEDFRERLENQKRAAGEKIKEIARNGGLSAEAEKAIRATLMGINPLRTL
jgi:hypothetical protein